MSFKVKIAETELFAGEESANKMFDMIGAPRPKKSWEVDFYCPELYNIFINDITRNLKMLNISLVKILENHNIDWKIEIDKVMEEVYQESINVKKD